MSSVASTTSSTSTLYTNRLSGLVSGMDTETMVKEMVDAERASRLDPLTQQKQLFEWKRDDYRETNTKLLALRTATFDIKLQTTFLSKNADSDDSTILTATAKATALSGNYSITVSQMAKGVTKESTPDSADYEYSGEDKTFTLTGKDGTATITVSDGNSISDIVTKINDVSSDTGIQATYDEDTNKFYLMSTETGAESKIEITDTDGIMADVFNMDLTSGSGQDAIIKFNGGSDISFSSNSFTFNNINFNLKKVGETNITIYNNVDTAVEKITAFVEAYNSAIEDISDKLSEKRYRDYEPLTDAQKAEMTETEIEQWEEKAKSGLLRGDSLLNGIYSNLRLSASNAVSGLDSDYKSLSSVGITTSDYTDKGKLYIDEDKLREALSDDPEGVMNMFTQTSDTSSEKGIAVQLYEQLNSAITNISNSAGSDSNSYDSSALGEQITDISEEISTAEDRLEELQEYYWSKFSAMEEALLEMQSQSSYLTSLLGE